MRKFKPNLLKRLIFPLFMACFTACSDTMSNDVDYPQNESGSNTVTITVTPEQLNRTRDDDSKTPLPYFGDGAKTDVLIFAVYERIKKDDDTYTYKILPEFQKSKDYVRGIKPGDGQNIIELSKDNYPYKIHLSLDPDKIYRVAFWAQNSKTEAFDTQNLEEVSIHYSKKVGDETVNFPNNDELRDAFSGNTDDFTVNTGTVNVVLHRPFAQINIGTTGADYTNLIYNEYIKPHGITITESKITLSNLADRYNALIDIASASQANISATFDWAPLPAWINIVKPEYYEEYNSYKKEKKEAGDKTWEDNPFVKTTDEEFLVVELNGDKKFEDYIIDYPTIKYCQDALGPPYIEYLTEKFKYLSMCYVLLPSASNYTIDVNDNTKIPGNLIKLSFVLRQKKDEDDSEPISLNTLQLLHVPACANWRTNILGGLYLSEDDPTSIFNTVSMTTRILDDFNIEYYIGGVNYGEEENQTE